jgi:hypothetical protein
MSSSRILESEKVHYINIPALSVDGRHMRRMSNLGTPVKFSRYLTAKSMSSLPEEQAKEESHNSSNPNTAQSPKT